MHQQRLPRPSKKLMLCTDAALLENFKGRTLVAFGGEWAADFLRKRNPGLELSEFFGV